jgi:hypothetical protein
MSVNPHFALEARTVAGECFERQLRILLRPDHRRLFMTKARSRLVRALALSGILLLAEIFIRMRTVLFFLSAMHRYIDGI